MAGGFVLRLLVRTAGFCAVLALFAWGFGSGGGVWAEVRNAKGVAVIIGNGEYEHRDVPDVRYAHRDAEAFRRYVVDVLGFNPENVIDLRDATRRKMFDALGTRSDPRSDLWSYLDPDGGSEVVPTASGSPPETATISSDSEWPERLPHESLPLYVLRGSRGRSVAQHAGRFSGSQRVAGAVWSVSVGTPRAYPQ